MDINRILEQIPDYREFLTIDELDQSSKDLAEEFDSVKMVKVGSALITLKYI